MKTEEQKLKQKLYYEKNKEKILLKQKNYKEKNREIILQKKREYKINNKEKIKEYYEKNKEQQKKNYEINKEKIKEYRKIYVKKRRENDPMFKLTSNLRTNIRKTLKLNGFKKSSKTEQILGCSYDEFKRYIESKFETWMNWDNQGNPKDNTIELNKTWDIDHIIPLSTATNELELLNLCNYKNLQPLCSYVNRYIKRNNT